MDDMVRLESHWQNLRMRSFNLITAKQIKHYKPVKLPPVAWESVGLHNIKANIRCNELT